MGSLKRSVIGYGLKHTATLRPVTRRHPGITCCAPQINQQETTHLSISVFRLFQAFQSPENLQKSLKIPEQLEEPSFICQFGMEKFKKKFLGNKEIYGEERSQSR